MLSSMSLYDAFVTGDIARVRQAVADGVDVRKGSVTKSTMKHRCIILAGMPRTVHSLAGP